MVLLVRLEEKKRREEFSAMQEKFKNSKQDITKEYERMQEVVAVDDDQKECRELAKSHRQWLDLSEIEALMSVFNKFDNDRSGMIDQSELKYLADYMRGDAEIKVKQQEVENEMRLIDSDQSNGIEFSEYVAYVASIKQAHREKGSKARGLINYNNKKLKMKEIVLCTHFL